MQTCVLGPVEVRDGARPVDLGTRRQRTIIAALAVADGLPVPTETVIERVWGERAPAGALATLHGYVAGLRRSLEPDRAPREAPRLLVTVDGGYALRTPREDRDDHALDAAVARARALLRAVPDHLRPRAEPGARPAVTEALLVLDRAVALWRGEPYPELGDDPAAQAERARLGDLHAAALELRVVARLALGRHLEVLPELGAMTAAHPLHERWWALQAVALARCGRQADALQALQSVRALLADELGIDPSPAVRELHTAILRQDPSLGWGEAVAAPPSRDLDPPPSPPRPARFRESPPVPRWPLAGRAAETGRLREVLDQVAAGRPHVVLVTGEAGVGKSRLAHELALVAFERGFTVAVGQCSPDEPPPLWPWRAMATSLDQQRGDLGDVVRLLDTAPAEEFATRESVARALCAAAREPLLLVLEDVQWGDEATRRLLVHLQSVLRHEPLCVVVTARLDGDTDRAVGDLAAALARGQTVRLDLDGLAADDAAVLVDAVAGAADPDTVRDLWERSAGNPFFLSELALSGGALSGSLSDVVLSRVRALPAETVRLLEAASVVDLVVDLDLLSLMAGRDQATTAELLAPALAAGLMVDEGRVHAAYRFAHGVVREAVYEAQPQQERAAWHREVSRVLEGHSGLRRPDQRAALAHHWELAGYGWVGEAWRSVLVAAEQARLDGAYDEEARLLRRAVDGQDLDLGSGDPERFELLVLLAEACRWSADWQGVSDAVDEAVVVAERLGDAVLAARAAISTMEGALWQVRPFGTVHHPIVEALERALVALPESERGLRCRAMMALAMELYYGGDRERIDALVRDALALADEGDHRLRAIAHVGAFAARARADAAHDRARYAAVAREAADAAGDLRLRLLAEAVGVSVASELGDVATVREALPRLSDRCRRRGLATAEAYLRVLEVPWLTMWGDHEQADASLARLGELAQRLRMPNLVDALTVTTVARSMLAGEYDALADMMASFVADTVMDAGPVAVVVLLRAGRVDLARELHERQGVDLSEDTFVGLVYACLACEIAAGLGDRELAAAAYPLALPYAGRMCAAGSAVPIGPVDTFLAWGAVALGDLAAASAHADAAVALTRAWGLTRVESELEELRRRYAV